MPKFIAAILPNFILRHAQGLRFPQLFLLFACLFVFDLLIPDFIPFIDELLFAMLALVFSRIKRRPTQPMQVVHD
ncbi:DUF6116 family protein [Uliginosibacterium sp. sgz301328]|uniref:DUF6116 family protein n=1 Tax=Uliginosibacterium sp. sgz301328 TaxID=3243764 RepID=UPI00359EE50C